MTPLSRIVHLSSVHSALDHRIFYKEARYAARSGYEVAIVAKHSVSETRDGVRIVALPARHSRLRRMMLAPWSVLKAAMRERADIYQFHDPELIPVGLLLKLAGKKVVYDIHEMTALQIGVKPWIPRPLRRPLASMFAAIERFAVGRFDGVTVPQIQMQKHYAPYARRVALTRNFVDVADIPEPLPWCERPNILYAGGLSKERGMLNMVRAMPYVRDGHRLNLVGRCHPALLNEARALAGWAKVDYTPEVPFDQIGSAYRRAALGLILYENSGQYHMAQAVKLFEFLAWGMPVVMPNFGEWTGFNEHFQCGINVETSDPYAVAAAINTLLDDPTLSDRLSENGRKLVSRQFSWDVEAPNLTRLYQEILSC